MSPKQICTNNTDIKQWRKKANKREPREYFRYFVPDVSNVNDLGRFSHDKLTCKHQIKD